VTHRQIIDLRDPLIDRRRTTSLWSRLPSLGPMNTAAAVADLYEEPFVATTAVLVESIR
jgi:hypothetical protein